MPAARSLAIAAAAVLLLVGCAGPADESVPEASVTTVPSSTASFSSAAPPTQSATPSASKVKVTLTSDVAESIQVHGYDKTVEVSPGKSGSVTFTADQKGVFDVETHETAKLTAKLIVA